LFVTIGGNRPFSACTLTSNECNGTRGLAQQQASPGETAAVEAGLEGDRGRAAQVDGGGWASAGSWQRLWHGPKIEFFVLAARLKEPAARKRKGSVSESAYICPKFCSNFLYSQKSKILL
jgi:hypothetical protein